MEHFCWGPGHGTSLSRVITLGFRLMTPLLDPWFLVWCYGYDVMDLDEVRARWQHHSHEHDTDRCYRDVPQAVILGLLDRLDRLEAAP